VEFIVEKCIGKEMMPTDFKIPEMKETGSSPAFILIWYSINTTCTKTKRGEEVLL
jgi:hypothetical protein